MHASTASIMHAQVPYFVITATKPRRAEKGRQPAHVREFHPIPLFSWKAGKTGISINKTACLLNQVAQLPQKPFIIYFYIISS